MAYDSHNVLEVSDLEHPALEPYRDLRHRNWTQHSGIFIAEGPLVTLRLIESGHAVESVLLDRKFFGQYIDSIPTDVPVIAVEHDLVERIVGFHFHRGVMACGRRPAMLAVSDPLVFDDPSETLLGLVGIQDPENVGGILRSAAGFGIRRVLIGPGTADPLSRRALRVSMGNSLRLEMFLSKDVLGDLNILSNAHVETVATTLSDDSVPLEAVKRHGPVIILMGNERNGLPNDIASQVDRRVRIDMSLGTDSLNVSVAAAVTMYHFCRVAVGAS